MSSVYVILKFKRAHLKFTVYGRKEASKQANIHTHVRNAVPLVWGSLRLAPITGASPYVYNNVISPYVYSYRVLSTS